MAVFYNQATLRYNDTTTSSNITAGEIREPLTVAKTALTDGYVDGTEKTYIISIVNSGSTAFRNLTIEDNLGSYSFGSSTIVPLTYVGGSVKYYVNGAIQTTPTVTAANGLTITGIDVPANGSAVIVYAAKANDFAPLAAESSITNEVTVTGDGIASAITASETINAEEAPLLTITKSLSPAVVADNGEITYTFVIQNTGNTAASVSDNVAITDTFDPVLENIIVTYNGDTWSAAGNYTYDQTTGVFSTVAGQITVPAAEYTQNSTTGEWSVVPGVSIITVTGTI